MYEAQKRYYHRNKQKYLDSAKARKQAMYEIICAAKDQPCADCGIRYPAWVMQFDHVRGTKEFTIGVDGRQRGLDALKAEIAKCDVVCANCHAERTHSRVVLKASIHP